MSQGLAREENASTCNHNFPLHWHLPPARGWHHWHIWYVFIFWPNWKLAEVTLYTFACGQCPLSKIEEYGCKIICRPAALSALMRCHLASLIICQAMLITYNCPRGAFSFPLPRMGIFWKSACTTFVILLFKLLRAGLDFWCICSALSEI